jgi:hypothetical protein
MNANLEPEQDIGFGVGKKKPTNFADDVRIKNLAKAFRVTIR